MSISRASKSHPTNIFFGIIMMAALCLIPVYAAADKLITGMYIFSSATEIVLNLSTPNLAPGRGIHRVAKTP